MPCRLELFFMPSGDHSVIQVGKDPSDHVQLLTCHYQDLCISHSAVSQNKKYLLLEPGDYQIDTTVNLALHAAQDVCWVQSSTFVSFTLKPVQLVTHTAVFDVLYYDYIESIITGDHEKQHKTSGVLGVACPKVRVTSSCMDLKVNTPIS